MCDSEFHRVRGLCDNEFHRVRGLHMTGAFNRVRERIACDNEFHRVRGSHVTRAFHLCAFRSLCRQDFVLYKYLLLLRQCSHNIAFVLLVSVNVLCHGLSLDGMEHFERRYSSFSYFL